MTLGDDLMNIAMLSFLLGVGVVTFLAVIGIYLFFFVED
jgi:hypothetical protein